jgi:hypothetical protein
MTLARLVRNGGFVRNVGFLWLVATVLGAGRVSAQIEANQKSAD